MDAEIEDLRKEINEFKEKNHKLQSVFNGLCKSLSNKQFDERISTVKKENQNYSERLQELQSGIAQISEEEKKKIEDEYEKNLKFWRQRKRMVGNEMFNYFTCSNYEETTDIKVYDPAYIESLLI
ncbi:4968_t:CDS:2 [Entrophospora sp. SA101]|nr:4963_t:CDS:2 [Entrophospora sp. SA101]CAJ0874892.1 4968_t:CDS:2 [Entrophospora sp. SA101]